MGCEQSTEIKKSNTRWSAKVLPRNPTIDPESRKEYNSYQDVLDGQVKKIMLEPEKIDELLQAYRESEEKISSMEKGDPLTVFYIKKSHMKNIDEAIKGQLDRIESLKNRQCGEPKSRRESTVRDVLIQIGTKKLTKADQELLTGKNKLEIALTELEMLHQEKAMTESDVNDLESILNELKEQYQTQDNILGQLSISKPTPAEAEIQKDLAVLETKRIKLSDVFERWKEGRSLVAEACRQISLALDKWRAIEDDTPANHYTLGEEIRDDLVTALQCLINAKSYIISDFPYCSKPEITVLEKAMAYLFIDMKTQERRNHAESCYTAFQKRAVALFAWIDMSMQAIVEPDMQKATADINEKIKSLRQIRMRFIRKQFPDVMWKEDMDLQPPAVEDSTAYTLSDPESAKVLSEIDVMQLAPLPSREEIFGKQMEVKITNYKSRLRDSVSKSQDESQSSNKNLKEVINEYSS